VPSVKAKPRIVDCSVFLENCEKAVAENKIQEKQMNEWMRTLGNSTMNIYVSSTMLTIITLKNQRKGTQEQEG